MANDEMKVRRLREIKSWRDAARDNQFRCVPENLQVFERRAEEMLEIIDDLIAMVDARVHPPDSEGAIRDEAIAAAEQIADHYGLGGNQLHLAAIITRHLRPTVDIDEPHDCALVAFHTGDGWALTVENSEHDVIGYLKWPESWPSVMTTTDLIAKGFVIV